MRARETEGMTAARYTWENRKFATELRVQLEDIEDVGGTSILRKSP